MNCNELELMFSVLHTHTHPAPPKLYKKQFQVYLETLFDDIKGVFLPSVPQFLILFCSLRVKDDTIYNCIDSQKRVHLRHVTEPLPFQASNINSER